MADHSPVSEEQRCPECEGASYVTYPTDHNATRTAPCPRCNASDHGRFADWMRHGQTSNMLATPAATGEEEQPCNRCGVRGEPSVRLNGGYCNDCAVMPAGVRARLQELLASESEMRRQLAEAEATMQTRAVARLALEAEYEAEVAALTERATTAERRLEEANGEWQERFDLQRALTHQHSDARAVAEGFLRVIAEQLGVDPTTYGTVLGESIVGALTASQQEVARLREALEEIRGRLRGGLPHADATDVQRSFELAEAALSTPHQSTGHDNVKG